MYIHHIGIIVKNIEKSLEIYKKLGYYKLSDIVIDEVQNNKIVFLRTEKDSVRVELIEPLDENSSIHNFASGYHHICYDVSDIEDFATYFRNLRIGKIFTKLITAPALDGRTVIFALLSNGDYVEFMM